MVVEKNVHKHLVSTGSLSGQKVIFCAFHLHALHRFAPFLPQSVVGTKAEAEHIQAQHSTSMFCIQISKTHKTDKIYCYAELDTEDCCFFFIVNST